MATATRKARPVRQIARGRGAASESASIEFLVLADNGGNYYWAIVDGSGETLASSGSFTSYDHAEAAARRVRAGAGSSRLRRRTAPGRPVDLAARRAATGVRDDLDAVGWMRTAASAGRGAIPRQAG